MHNMFLKESSTSENYSRKIRMKMDTDKDFYETGKPKNETVISTLTDTYD